MGDWLGNGNVSNRDKKYQSFERARKYARSLELSTVNQWRQLGRLRKLFPDIPSGPHRVYKKKGWKGYGDFLGTWKIAPKDKKYRSFEQARAYARSLGLKSRTDWEKHCRSHKIPNDIPTHPDREYGDKWSGWGNWLGTYTIAPQNKRFRPFQEAREFARSLNLASETEWQKFCTSGEKPEDIHSHPDQRYKDEWKGWGDFLGTYRVANQTTGWSIQKVKELIKDLVKNKVIDEWPEDLRYHLLFTKGVLNLSKNRFSKLLQNLTIGPKTEGQRKALQDFANSEDEYIPDIGNEIVQTVSTEKLAELVDEEGNTDALENENIQTTEQILELTKTDYLESICQDVELMQFFVNYFVDKLWKSAFREEEMGTTAKEKRIEVQTGKKFHDTVAETFLAQYDAMEKLEIPKGYSFLKPRLMQRYVAYKIKTEPYFGNFSWTGAGKTVSAILASRVIDSKMTLVVCPNDVVMQWATEVVKVFPDSKVITGKPAFDAEYDGYKHQYLVVNYDKFSQAHTQADRRKD